MKLRINDECEVEIDWGAQTVMVRRAEIRCPAEAEWKPAVYTWAPSKPTGKYTFLVVNGIQAGDYCYLCGPYGFRFQGKHFDSRDDARAAVIARYEADHA